MGAETTGDHGQANALRSFLPALRVSSSAFP